MGNDLSSLSILPLSFGKCFVNGELNIRKYQLYLLVKKKGKKILTYKSIAVILSTQMWKKTSKEEEYPIREEALNPNF